ncbi:MAG: hypothetical protein IKP88_12790 [Lachnospiraceae bacterium]|nr:hypothetical protein [Lachnospiraceae bacterium]
MSKKIITFGKLFAIIAVVVAAIIINGSISVHADNGETVRVSTAKELKAAIKNADVGTIIFRTKAYINVTIKADTAAKGKSLIIDAPNASITNKAVFANINILNADFYTENVSGNIISLSDCYMSRGFTVAKKKKVKSLTVYDSSGSFFNFYTLRKGAKINELELVYSGDMYPAKSSYNKSKRLLTISCTNDECERSYKIKLDKSGRMVSIDCDSNWSEADYEETFKYDSNGNIIQNNGRENMSGNYTMEKTYSGNLVQKSVYKDEYSSGVYTYTYDKDGKLVHFEYKGESTMDGDTSQMENTYDFEYDKKGREIYERWEDTIIDTFREEYYTFNSKGFLTEVLINTAGAEAVYKYKYNKAGDLIQETYISEGYTTTTTYEYDELGYLIGRQDS